MLLLIIIYEKHIKAKLLKNHLNTADAILYPKLPYLCVSSLILLLIMQI